MCTFCSMPVDGWRDGQWIGPPWSGCFPQQMQPAMAQHIPLMQMPSGFVPGQPFMPMQRGQAPAACAAGGPEPVRATPAPTVGDVPPAQPQFHSPPAAPQAAPTAGDALPAGVEAPSGAGAPHPRAGAAPRAAAAPVPATSRLHLTDARLLVIVVQADAEDYAHAILSGKKGECLTNIHTKLSLATR